MLVVTVEIWPGGSPLRKKVIGAMQLANVSQLAEVSNYEGYLDDSPVAVQDHFRADGAWELVRRAIIESRRGD